VKIDGISLPRRFLRLDLSPGRIVEGVVVRRLSPNRVVLNLGGANLTAEAENGFPPQDRLRFRVRETGDRLVLEFVREDAAPPKGETGGLVRSLLRAMGLPSDEAETERIRALLSRYAPSVFRREFVETASLVREESLLRLLLSRGFGGRRGKKVLPRPKGSTDNGIENRPSVRLSADGDEVLRDLRGILRELARESEILQGGEPGPPVEDSFLAAQKLLNARRRKRGRRYWSARFPVADEEDDGDCVVGIHEDAAGKVRHLEVDVETRRLGNLQFHLYPDEKRAVVAPDEGSRRLVEENLGDLSLPGYAVRLAEGSEETEGGLDARA
jgi:hypothetical protein